MKKEKKNSGITKNFWDFELCHMTIGTPEGKGENGTEEIFEEIMTGNVPRFGTNTKSQIQKAQRMSINTNSLHLGISYSSYKKKEKKRKRGVRENKETTVADGCGKNITY